MSNRSRLRKNKNKSMFVKEIMFNKDDSLRKKIDKRMINLNVNKNIEAPKNITAKSYIIYRTGLHGSLPKVVLSENSKNRQEIASLTKIMTAILTI